MKNTVLFNKTQRTFLKDYQIDSKKMKEKLKQLKLESARHSVNRECQGILEVVP